MTLTTEPSIVTDPLLAWRKHFPILAHTTYMVSHSLGAMPQGASDGLKEYAEVWASRGVRAWKETWWDMPVTVGDLVGRIIGAAPETVVMQPNVAICQNIVTSCFDWTGRRNKLVTDGLNFPSNDYVYGELEAKPNGPRMVSVASDDGMTIPLERILDAIDEETLLVSISHVAFRSSTLHDLKTITEHAHSVGALVFADLYQSAGIVPVDVTSLNLDFATGGSVKWLLGGPGAGYLYVRPDHIGKLRPSATGWAAHAQPFSFAPAPIVFDHGIRRFQNGTPNISALYGAKAGYQMVAEIGTAAIREKSQRQTQRLIALADEHGFTVRTMRDPKSRGGVVILDIPNGKEVTAELARREVLVDFRPGAGIRMAPFFYTADEEIAHTLDEIQDIINRG